MFYFWHLVLFSMHILTFSQSKQLLSRSHSFVRGICDKRACVIDGICWRSAAEVCVPKEGTRLLFAYGGGTVAGIMQPAPRL